MTAQILFYTDAAQIRAADLTALRKAGIIPIKVADQNAARLVTADAGMPIAPNAMLLEAMRVISKNSSDSTRSAFVVGLARILEESATDAKRADQS